MRRYILASLSIAAAGSSHAFQFKTSFAYANGKSDFLSFDLHTFGVTGRSYLTEVDSGGHPLQEAALLDQVSSLNASYNYTDPGATEFSTINIGGQFWLPQGFLNLQFVKLEADRFQSEQAYTAEIGHSPSNQSLLAVGIISGDFDTIFTARGKLLLNLQSDNPLNLQVTYSHDSQDPNFEFNMDYYVDRTFSVGAFYDNDDLIGLDVQKFITLTLESAR